MTTPEAVDPTAVQKRRDQRVTAFETIGSAIAVLRKLDYIWCDEDVRDALTRVRATLSVAQSTIKARIDAPQ
jgi:hypothetical protein